MKERKIKDKSPDNTGLLSALKERVKELDCLYKIGDISHQPDLEKREVLSHIVNIIPPAMQYPELASSRLILDGSSISSHALVQGPVQISTEVVINYSQRGLLEVFYNEGPDGFIPEFLEEEQRLLNTIGKQISLVIERKYVEENNTQLQDQLRHADRLATIGQLAAGIAHEINEPLATIMGFAQLIGETEALPPQAKRDAERIVSATLHAREVIRKLMLFSRQVPPNMTEVHLNKIISDGFYFLESRCERQQIRIVKSLDSSDPVIIADSSQIHQVMVNLVVNAMQAMPGGGELSLGTIRDGKMVEFYVRDSGSGMSKEVLDKIFIPFYTTKDIDQGTGLGLSVVHGIVTNHNGKVLVESEPGKGSIFRLFFEVMNA